MSAHIDQKPLTHELKEMKDKGMRGAIIWNMEAVTDLGKGIPPARQIAPL